MLSAWKEQSIVREVDGERVFWVDLVHWMGGAQLVARVDNKPYPIRTVAYPLPPVWLLHFERIKEDAMSFLKKVKVEEQAVAAARSKEWSRWKQDHPALAEYMETEVWEDGAPRLTSTLLLFLDQGAVKACLNDRETERTLWVTAGSIEEAIDVLEASLAGGTAEWRTKWKPAEKGPPKKGKK